MTGVFELRLRHNTFVAFKISWCWFCNRIFLAFPEVLYCGLIRGVASQFNALLLHCRRYSNILFVLCPGTPACIEIIQFIKIQQLSLKLVINVSFVVFPFCRNCKPALPTLPRKATHSGTSSEDFSMSMMHFLLYSDAYFLSSRNSHGTMDESEGRFDLKFIDFHCSLVYELYF